VGSSVTITPDERQVTITPDAAQAPERTWMDSAKDFANGLWQQVNPMGGVRGIHQLATHPIQSYMADAENRQDIEDQAEKDFKNGNYASGVAHALYGIIPFMGAQMNEAGTNIQQGDVAKGLGQSVGMGLATAIPTKISDMMKIGVPSGAADIAARQYQSALKPSTVLPRSEVQNMVQTGLNNAIPVSPSGIEKLGSMVDDLNQKIAGEIAKNPNQPINKYSVASRLGKTAQQFGTQVNPEGDLNAVSESGNEFLRNQPTDIPASDAQALKQGTYRQLGDKAYGELSSATMESQKALARGLKEELAIAFPELSGLNAQDSQLLNLQDTLQRAVNRISNHQIAGIGTPMAAAGAKAITGSTGAAGVAALMKAVFDDPLVKSKLAIALNRASKNGITIPMAQAKLGGYLNALGNASNAQPVADQGTQ
jgi:hypothetical protein